MIKVVPRANHRDDRAGDPLDGLVNLFDLGIVLAVAFLLAALSSLNLTGTLKHGLKPVSQNGIPVAPGQTIHELPTPGAPTVGRGTQVGTVYQLPNGQLVYVEGTPSSTTPSTTPSTSQPTSPTTPTPGSTPPVIPPPTAAATP